MNRLQLEHLIRAAGDIAGDDEIIIVGSSAVLGQFPEVPEQVVRSVEADVFPKNKPELAGLIDGSIGELSPFHQTFGYYAHGVGPETAGNLPTGWEKRLVALRNENTRGVTGWTVEVHDLVLGKYLSGREKDFEFNKQLIDLGILSRENLLDRLRDWDLQEATKAQILWKIKADFLPEG